MFHLAASVAFSVIRRLSALRTTSSATSFTWPLRLLLSFSSWFTVFTSHILTVPSSEPDVYESPPGAYLTQCTGPWWPLLHPAFTGFVLKKVTTHRFLKWKKLTNLFSGLEIKPVYPHIFSSGNESVPVFRFQGCWFNVARHLIALHQSKTGKGMTKALAWRRQRENQKTVCLEKLTYWRPKT